MQPPTLVDTISIDKINREAWAINRKDAQKAIELSRTALEEAKALNYRHGIACALKTLGTAHIWLSKNEEAATYCFEAISIFNELGDKINEGETSYYVGANFFYLSDYDTCIKYYNKCFDINNEINYEPGMANGLNGLGTVYYTIEENEKALDMLNRSHKLCLKNNTVDVLARVLDGLGETYYNLKDYDKALKYYEECIPLAQELGGFKQVEAFALDGLGRTYTGKKQFEKAFEKYNLSLGIRREIGFKFGEATTLSNIGNLFIEKGDFEKAIDYLQQAYELAVKISSKEAMYKSSEKLAEIYEKLGKFEEAIKFFKISHTAREEVRNEKTGQLVKSVELQHKMLQSQAERLLLEEKAKELESFSNNLVLLGEIGQQIISHLSVETIVDTVYGHVNSLMDATGFGIGLHKPDLNQVVYPLYIEGDEKFQNIIYNLSDPDRLTNICFNERKEIVINDFDKEIQQYLSKYQAPLFGKTVQSIIYLPLVVKNEIMGVITVQSFKTNAYSAYHVNMLRNLAAFASIALENARLYEEQEKQVEQRTKELVVKKEEVEKAYDNNRLLSEIGQQITSTLNLSEIFEKLNHFVGQLMDAGVFGVRIYRPERQVIEYKYGIEKGVLKPAGIEVSMDDVDNYSVWCVTHKKEIFINDNLTEYKKYTNQIRVVSGDMPHSLIFYPMMIGDRVLGVITVQSFNRNAYIPYHLDILKTLASYTVIALDNASLYESMEEKVKARTLEVMKQKEEVEKTYENTRLLSQLGKEITSTLSIEEIIDKAYDNVNNLMDAFGFGIGVYKAESNLLVYPLYIEGEERFRDIVDEVSNERLAGISYMNQQDIVINNFREEIIGYVGKYQAPLEGQEAGSIIYTPLFVKEKVIGVITVQSLKLNAYTDYHVQILKNLAVYVAIAIDNASLYSNMEQRVKERTAEIEKNYADTKLLSQIAEDISSSLSLETIISKVYRNINSLMKAECFGIATFNPQNGLLECKGFVENGKVLPDFAYDISDNNRLATKCFNNSEEIFINDYTVDYKKYIKGIDPPIAGKDSVSIIYLPIFSKEKTIGVISVQSYQKNAYSDYHHNILKNLAVSVGIAIDNANLYQNMEEKVKERTLEVVKQKEEIEKAGENTRLLSQIGKDITSTLSIEEIIDKVYENVNALMDAKGFGIGVYQPEDETVIFPLYIEGDEKFENITYKKDEKDRLTNICFYQNREIVINDFKNEIQQYVGYQQAPLQGKVVESIIYLPLLLKEKVIGVITVQSFNVNAYTDYHVQILKNLAVYVAIAIDNASLYRNMEQRVKERTAEIEKNYADTKLLSQIAEDISASLSVETIISKVYQNINKLMAADCFGIAIFNPHNRHLEFKGFVENDQVVDDFSIDVSDLNRLANICFVREKEIFINDYIVEYSKYISGIKAPVVGKDSSSIIYLPVVSKDVIIGVLTVQSYTRNVYSNYHLNILKNLAISIGIALDNASLYQNMEEKVKERTLEVVKQKEEIEKTYENTRLLSQLGKDVTSTLSIDEVISKVYSNINSLMDASVFAIGIYREDTKKLEFSGTMEKGRKLDDFAYDLTQDTLAVNCFNTIEEIFINDYSVEYSKYSKKEYTAVQGDDTESMMFIRIYGKDKKLGVISVQSFSKNAYTDYHLNMLRNLAVYIGIAIDNASLYENMEDRVVERTAEVTRQKEQLEKNFQDTKLVAQITKDLSSSLSLETIVSKVYENVNNLMSAESFGIGLYNSQTKSIQFNGYIEHSEKMPFFEFPVSDKNRLAVYCFEKESEIIINDLQKEYNKYIKNLGAPVAGGSPESIVYIPLFNKDKKIGVITVQSFIKHAYSDYQISILRNLALSISIALDNASLYENLEEKVRERTEEVIAQKVIIEEKNKDITDSIKYAKKIQLALIPDPEVLRQPFPDSFIYYRPKDIVSGDFYWIENFSEDVTVFAVADCTGHGVPGAFMSLICNDLMSQVIKDQNVTTPGQALTILDNKLRAMLNKSSDHSANDGMDIALCAYHKSSMMLQFAGAHRPLIIVRNGELIEYKPSKHSIGGYLTGNKIFDDNNIQIQKGDCIYVLTDGYSDQFGGESGKKFKFKKLQKLILNIAHMTMEEQHDLLEEAFVSWRGRHEQVDDVCVIGIRI